MKNKLIAAFLSIIMIMSISSPLLAVALDSDSTPPSLTSITIDKTQITAPGSINISADVKDDISGVSSVYVYYNSPQTNKAVSCPLIYNYVTNKYEGSLNLDKYAENGVYKFFYIYLYDKSLNSVALYQEDISTNINFSVIESTIQPLDITYTTQNEYWTNQTINGDVYVGPQSVLTIDGSVTVNGNIYVLGAIKNYGNLNVTGTVYANNFNWGYSTLYNGTVLMLGGTNSMNGMEASNRPIQDMPFTLYTSPIKPINGKISIQGATLPIMDLYLDGVKVNLEGNGTFDIQDFDIGNNQKITFEFIDVFGNKIDKTFNIEKIQTNITGVTDGGMYNTDKTITFDNATATLNGKPFNSGDIVNAEANYVLIVTDTDGNSTTINFSIDKATPIISIGAYDGTTPTNQNITVTATTDKGTLNTASHTFTTNGSFDFVATDAAGNVTTKTVTISNIDKVAPVVTIGAINTAPTKNDITVTATTNDGTLNSTSHTFTINGSFDFVATDAAGNVTTKTVTISNIDKVAPVVTIGAINTAPTKNDITVTATTNDGTLNSTSHTFTANGSFDFVATDAAGNVTTKTVTITNINKIAIADVTVVLTIGSTDATRDGAAMTGMDQAPVIVNGRTFLPVRFVLQNLLGGTCNWDAATQTITSVVGSNTIKMVIDSKIAVVNGVNVALLEAPFIEAATGRTVVPMREIMQAIGVTVDWNALTYTVTLTIPQ